MPTLGEVEITANRGSTDTNSEQPTGLSILQGRVREIFLNEGTNHSNGRIEILVADGANEDEGNKYDLTHAFPLNIYDFTLPAINESVMLIKDETGRFFYFSIPPVNFYDQLTFDNEDDTGEEEEENLKVNLHSYKNFSVNDDAETEIYGTTFTEDLVTATDVVNCRNVHEGDKVIQGRFGNSIKFTCKNELNEAPWSLDGEDGKPVIAIRTGELPDENPTEDNSFIYLLSDQSLDLGEIAFSPESSTIGDPMDTYVGGQVIIGADRLTFLSKADDISISSAGLVSIATTKWAVDFDVLMDQVKALATQLDALCAGTATLVTGVGPTGVGTNTADCAAIVSEIEGMEQ